jgi:hypothetical protein
MSSLSRRTAETLRAAARMSLQRGAAANGEKPTLHLFNGGQVAHQGDTIGPRGPKNGSQVLVALSPPHIIRQGETELI